MSNFPGSFRACDRCGFEQHDAHDDDFSRWGNGLRINVRQGSEVHRIVQDLCPKCLLALIVWCKP